MLWFADFSLCLVCDGNRAHGAGSMLEANGFHGFSFLISLGLNSGPDCIGINLGKFCYFSGPTPGLLQ